MKSSLRKRRTPVVPPEKRLDLTSCVMSLAAAGVLRRAALNAVRLNTFRAAPARTLSTGPKKPAAELTFKEAWLSDPATYPIVVIISSP